MTTSLVPARPVALPTVYDRAQNVAEFLVNVGRAIHSSGMFGCESPSQGYVLALECAARRMPPLALAERYHLIKGKLSMKAEAMLADFIASSGSHEIIERTPDKAAVKLVRNRKSRVFELAWIDAAKEPFVYEGKEADVIQKLAAGDGKGLKLKPKYATPRSRMQMLWARLISDSIRAMAADVVAGHYVPEEVGDYADVDLDTLPAEVLGEEAAEADTTVTPPTVDAEQAEIDRLKAEAAVGLAAAKAETERLAASAPPEHRKPAAAPQPVKTATPTAAQPPAGKATPAQVGWVKALVTELNVPREKLAAMLERAKAAKVSDLTGQQCAALIDTMEKEKTKRAHAGN